MRLSDDRSVSPLVVMLTKLRFLVCAWHKCRYECKQMDPKEPLQVDGTYFKKVKASECECVWSSEVCMCVRRYYLAHCVNVRIFVEVIQCPAIKTLALGMRDFSFTCIFTRTFTRLSEKSQMRICQSLGGRPRTLMVFRHVKRGYVMQSERIRHTKSTVITGHVKILNTVIYFTNFDKSFGVTNTLSPLIILSLRVFFS